MAFSWKGIMGMSEIERLEKRLTENSARILDVFLGDTSSTPEEIAKEINRILDLREAGELVISESFSF